MSIHGCEDACCDSGIGGLPFAGQPVALGPGAGQYGEGTGIQESHSHILQKIRHITYAVKFVCVTGYGD